MPRSAEAQPWFRRSVLHSQPTRSARAVAHTPTRVGAPAARAECVRLPRARGGVRPTQIPPYSLPATPPTARALLRARAGVCQACKCVLPRAHLVGRFLSPYLLNVCLLLSARSQTRRWQVVLHARVHPSLFLPVNSPRTASAHPHRVRAPPPPTRMHTAPQLPSPETAPPPRAGGLASHARRRRSALRPRRRRPQPSGGLHARRSHPATHTGCLASPKHTGCPFLHAAPPQTLDLDYRV